MQIFRLLGSVNSSINFLSFLASDINEHYAWNLPLLAFPLCAIMIPSHVIALSSTLIKTPSFNKTPLLLSVFSLHRIWIWQLCLFFELYSWPGEGKMVPLYNVMSYPFSYMLQCFGPDPNLLVFDILFLSYLSNYLITPLFSSLVSSFSRQ